MDDINTKLYDKNLVMNEAKSFKASPDYKCQFLLYNDINIKLIPYQDKTIHLSEKKDNDKVKKRKQKKNATLLYINMMLLGLNEAIAINELRKFKFRNQKYPLHDIVRSQTHHVIPMESYDYVKQIDKNINLNDGRNGIILPYKDNAIFNFAKGSPHKGSHPNYTKEVERRIATSKSEDELWAIVDVLKWELYEEKIELN